VTLPAGYPTNTTTNPNNYVAELQGTGSQPVIGPGIVLKVMSGDQFSVRVSSWYQLNGATTGTPVSPLTDILSALISGIGKVPGEGAPAAALQANSAPLSSNVLQFLSDTGATIVQTKPHAFLNWVLFDNQFNYVAASSGFQQVGASGMLTAIVETNLPITSSAYLYIYVSNETSNIPVFFDNLQVTQTRGPLLEEDHYYPFGLLMSGISDRALKQKYAENKYRFNKGSELENKEFSDGSGLEMYATHLRELDPQLGRWWQIDPKPTQAESPYASMGNNPIFRNDPLGDTTGHGFTQGVGTGYTRFFKNAWNAVTNPGQTLKNAFSLKSLGENALNVGTMGMYGTIKEINNDVKTVQSQGTYGLGTVVGNKLAQGTVVAAGEIGGKVADAFETAGSTTLYRAASSAEVKDMSVNGVRNISTGYQTGKLFATSAEDAAQYGKNNFKLDGVPNTIVEVRVPNSVMKISTTFEADAMKAVSVPANQLPSLRVVGPLNYSPRPSDPLGIGGW
jgi:RHS repeat-associated protein